MDKKAIGEVVGLYIKDRKDSKVKSVEKAFLKRIKG